VTTQEAFLASEPDIEAIDALLCSAQEPIGLSKNFVGTGRRPERLEWLKRKIEHRLLWIVGDIGDLAGVLILRQDVLARVVGIDYIIVTEWMRGRREIGPLLVRKAQALADAGFLEAEARNDNSRRLLESFGFRPGQEPSASGHPILIWSRS
jgi:ribosomal protein S18 acetylase RimI-like enzyme